MGKMYMHSEDGQNKVVDPAGRPFRTANNFTTTYEIRTEQTG